MSDEHVSNALVKVSTELGRNIDKASNIRALWEYNNDKAAKIKCLKGEKDLDQKNNEAFISMVEEIGNHALKARPHL